jgi:Kef-type K+ transport system membrane component KefB
MLNEDLLRTLGLIVVAAAVFGLLARLVRLPSIIAFLFVGILLGPITGLVSVTDEIQLISELGVVLLLFIVGLELSFDKIRDVGKVAFVAGLGQVAFTVFGGYFLGLWLGFDPIHSLFLAVGLTFSSTVVAVKLLTDKGELDSLYGRIAVGNSLVQTLVVIIALTILSGLSPEANSDPWMIFGKLLKAFGGMIVLLGGVVLCAKFVLPAPFAWAARSPATLFVWSLGWCFVVVAAAYHLQLSMELGAFLAGLSLAQLPYNRDLQHRIKPVMNFFVAIFFVGLGTGVSLVEARDYWVPVVVLSCFVLIGNPFIFMVLIPRFGYSERTAFLTAVTGAQISEFSFVFAAMGVTAGLIGSSVVSITAMIGIVTIACSAYLILYNHQIYHWMSRVGLLRIFGAGHIEDEKPEPQLQNHVIVVGMNTLGRKLAAALHEKGEHVVAVDTDPRKLRGLACQTALGNIEFRDVLEEVSLSRAKLLISALQIEEANELLAYRCQACGVPSVIHAIDLSVVDGLLELGVAYLMLPKVDGVKLQTELLRKEGVIGS